MDKLRKNVRMGHTRKVYYFKFIKNYQKKKTVKNNKHLNRNMYTKYKSLQRGL